MKIAKWCILMNKMMYHILRVVLYRLWAVSTFTLFSSVIVFWLYGFVVAFAVFVVGVFGILYSAQDLLLFYPNDPPDSRIFVAQPSKFNLPFESIKVSNKDGYKIHMFLIKQATDSKHRPTMVFFHGNAGNMGQRLANVSGFYQKLSINILMVEYRGFGLSEGSPSEQGLYLDAQTAVDYALQRNDLDSSKIVLFGRSLGGAVAIDIASRLEYKNKIWALIIENTFTSIPDMARVLLKWKCLRWLPLFCHKNKFMSIQKMEQIVTPTLIICGSKDTLVPPTMSVGLFSKCPAIYKKLEMFGGGHDDTWTCGAYYPNILRFLSNVPSLPPETGPFFDEVKHKSSTVHVV